MDTTDELDALFKEAIGTFEGLLERAHTEQPPERPFACKAGCTSCCYQPEITITAIEVFRLAKFIGAQFSDDQIADLIKTLPETLKLPLVPLDPTSWSQTVCPLLRDGVCSVYDARPLVCRGGNSYDDFDCEMAREQNRQHMIIRNYALQERAARLTIEVLQIGMASAG
ncbi:MAG: YkgJ family cysteine cluster protein, partial [Rhodospirillaceae bacterium]|nr:YkgJ family cysteine cluster protein [Rhodospirillaceae bacterium]